MESTPKINTIHYVFANRQPQVKALITSWGFTPAKTENGLWKQINFVVAKYPEQALMALASIHPDRDLILSTIKNVEPINPAIITPEVIKEVVKEETKSNACGCMGGRTSGCDGVSTCNCDKKSNVDGEADKKATAPIKSITPETANVIVPKTVSESMMGAMPILMVGLVVTAIAFMAVNSAKLSR